MTPGRVACGFAVLALVCVLGIFFCPVVSGPYSAVHGPVTALLSIRAAARLRMTIVRGGLGAIRGWFGRLGAALTMLSWSALASTSLELNGLPSEFSTILRC